MKIKIIAIFILMSALLPLYSKGMFSNEPELEVQNETPVANVEPLETPVQSSPYDELYVKLNQVGFETPTNGILPAVDFQLPNLSGVDVKLSDYRGQVVFLNFWATWCGPCRSEMPSMEKVYNELKNEGFVILAVDLAEDNKTVQSFVDELGITFPVVLDQSGEVGGAYDARSIPTTYIIGRDGNILGRAIGVRPWEEDSYKDLFREILSL